MSHFIEISLTERTADGGFKPITGSALKPYLDALNSIVGITELHQRKAAELAHKPIPAQTIPVNIDELGQDYGFRIMQHKLVLMCFWGTDHTRDSDIAAFGEKFPDVHMSITESGIPKANGNLSALKHYVRRDYLRGECVATWLPEPIVWVQRGY